MVVFVYLAPCRDPSETHNGIVPCETTTATPKGRRMMFAASVVLPIPCRPSLKGWATTVSMLAAQPLRRCSERA